MRTDPVALREHFGHVNLRATIAVAARVVRRLGALIYAVPTPVQSEARTQIKELLDTFDSVATGDTVGISVSTSHVLLTSWQTALPQTPETRRCMSTMLSFIAPLSHMAPFLDAMSRAVLLKRAGSPQAADALESARTEFGYIVHSLTTQISNAISLYPDLEFPVRYDIESMSALGAGSPEQLDYTLDPALFGPLWPFGRPTDWPEDVPLQDIDGIVLKCSVPAGMTDSQAIEYVRDFASRLNKLHRALGGSGLKVVPPTEFREPVRTPAGVRQ